VYDKGTLHRLVGIPPREVVVHDTKDVNGTTMKRNGAVETMSVKSAWESAEGASEVEENKPSSSTQVPQSVDADAEGSRYGIPLRKRRRTGPSIVTHTVYTTEDEDDEGGDRQPREDQALHVVGDGLHGDVSDGLDMSESEAEAVEEEAVTVENKALQTGKGKSGVVKIDRKRAYWASKGLVTSGNSPSP